MILRVCGGCPIGLDASGISPLAIRGPWGLSEAAIKDQLLLLLTTDHSPSWLSRSTTDQSLELSSISVADVAMLVELCVILFFRFVKDLFPKHENPISKRVCDKVRDAVHSVHILWAKYATILLFSTALDILGFGVVVWFDIRVRVQIFPGVSEFYKLQK